MSGTDRNFDILTKGLVELTNLRILAVLDEDYEEETFLTNLIKHTHEESEEIAFQS